MTNDGESQTRSLIRRGEMGFFIDRGFEQTHAHAFKKMTAHRQLKAKKIRADNASSKSYQTIPY